MKTYAGSFDVRLNKEIVDKKKTHWSVNVSFS
jgi:hypothetical protein